MFFFKKNESSVIVLNFYTVVPNNTNFLKLTDGFCNWLFFIDRRIKLQFNNIITLHWFGFNFTLQCGYMFKLQQRGLLKISKLDSNFNRNKILQFTVCIVNIDCFAIFNSTSLGKQIISYIEKFFKTFNCLIGLYDIKFIYTENIDIFIKQQPTRYYSNISNLIESVQLDEFYLSCKHINSYSIKGVPCFFKKTYQMNCRNILYTNIQTQLTYLEQLYINYHVGYLYNIIMVGGSLINKPAINSSSLCKYEASYSMYRFITSINKCIFDQLITHLFNTTKIYFKTIHLRNYSLFFCCIYIYIFILYSVYCIKFNLDFRKQFIKIFNKFNLTQIDNLTCVELYHQTGLVDLMYTCLSVFGVQETNALLDLCISNIDNLFLNLLKIKPTLNFNFLKGVLLNYKIVTTHTTISTYIKLCYYFNKYFNNQHNITKSNVLDCILYILEFDCSLLSGNFNCNFISTVVDETYFNMYDLQGSTLLDFNKMKNYIINIVGTFTDYMVNSGSYLYFKNLIYKQQAKLSTDILLTDMVLSDFTDFTDTTLNLNTLDKVISSTTTDIINNTHVDTNVNNNPDILLNLDDIVTKVEHYSMGNVDTIHNNVLDQLDIINIAVIEISVYKYFDQTCEYMNVKLITYTFIFDIQPYFIKNIQYNLDLQDFVKITDSPTTTDILDSGLSYECPTIYDVTNICQDTDDFIEFGGVDNKINLIGGCYTANKQQCTGLLKRSDVIYTDDTTSSQKTDVEGITSIKYVGIDNKEQIPGFLINQLDPNITKQKLSTIPVDINYINIESFDSGVTVINYTTMHFVETVSNNYNTLLFNSLDISKPVSSRLVLHYLTLIKLKLSGIDSINIDTYKTTLQSLIDIGVEDIIKGVIDKSLTTTNLAFTSSGELVELVDSALSQVNTVYGVDGKLDITSIGFIQILLKHLNKPITYSKLLTTNDFTFNIDPFIEYLHDNVINDLGTNSIITKIFGLRNYISKIHNVPTRLLVTGYNSAWRCFSLTLYDIQLKTGVTKVQLDGIFDYKIKLLLQSGKFDDLNTLLQDMYVKGSIVNIGNERLENIISGYNATRNYRTLDTVDITRDIITSSTDTSDLGSLSE